MHQGVPSRAQQDSSARSKGGILPKEYYTYDFAGSVARAYCAPSSNVHSLYRGQLLYSCPSFLRAFPTF